MLDKRTWLPLLFAFGLTACGGLGGEPQIIATATAAYARLQSLAEPAETAAANPGLPIGSFTGAVRHGTAGGRLPPNMAAQLQYGNAELGFSLAETRLDDDFRFRFENIPLTSAFSYQVGVVYRGRLFSHRRPAGHPTEAAYHQDIAVYDLTHDSSMVTVSRIDMLIEAVRLGDLGRGLRVSQLLRYRNRSDRIYTSGRGLGDGREASLLIQIPSDAQVMRGDANGRYLIIEDLEQAPDSIIDTQPVFPGDVHEVPVEYFLPYVDGLTLEQPFSNVIQGEVTVTLSDHLDVVSDSLHAESGPAGQGRVFSGQLDSPKLAFEIRGNPFATSSDDRTVITSETLLPLGLGIGALAAAALAAVWMLARRHRRGESRQIDSLIQQIAQLDDKHDRGQINHDLYQRRRRALKERLARLMQANSAESRP